MTEKNGGLIVALDCPTRKRIVEVATAVQPYTSMVKVGLEPFIICGPDLVRELIDKGLDVFLDLKIYDIPRTAAAATLSATKLGVKMMTIHASGGRAMIRAVAESTDAHVVAVTMLTSFDDEDALDLGLNNSVKAVAFDWATLAIESGADGVVCSAHELAHMACLSGTRVVPGIRPESWEGVNDDQKRKATPRQAVDAGATWIVVGRPITQSSEPGAAAKALVESSS